MLTRHMDANYKKMKNKLYGQNAHGPRFVMNINAEVEIFDASYADDPSDATGNPFESTKDWDGEKDESNRANVLSARSVLDVIEYPVSIPLKFIPGDEYEWISSERRMDTHTLKVMKNAFADAWTIGKTIGSIAAEKFVPGSSSLIDIADQYITVEAHPLISKLIDTTGHAQAFVESQM